jgi:hypothetical protein
MWHSSTVVCDARGRTLIWFFFKWYISCMYVLHLSVDCQGCFCVRLGWRFKYKKAPQARVGSQPLHQGRKGVGGGGAQIRRKLPGGVWGFRAPPLLNLYGVAVQCLFSLSLISSYASGCPHPRLRVPTHINITSLSEHPCIEILL